MSDYQNYVTPEMLEVLKTPEGWSALEALAARHTAHKANPLYGEAKALFERVQARQIAKGAEKYPEPLKAASWSLPQLIDHAMEEVVDQVHYITAIKERGDQLAVDLELGNMATNMLLSIAEMAGRMEPRELLAEVVGKADAFKASWERINGQAKG